MSAITKAEWDNPWGFDDQGETSQQEEAETNQAWQEMFEGFARDRVRDVTPKIIEALADRNFERAWYLAGGDSEDPGFQAGLGAMQDVLDGEREGMGEPWYGDWPTPESMAAFVRVHLAEIKPKLQANDAATEAEAAAQEAWGAMVLNVLRTIWVSADLVISENTHKELWGTLTVRQCNRVHNMCRKHPGGAWR